MAADPQLERYKRLLLEWNEKVNLIGPEAKANLDDHISEALAAAEFLNPSGEVLDFGTGGGLPAIPMAIVSPAARFHLVEVDQKKWAFLKHVVRECRLNAVVHGDTLKNVLPRLPPNLQLVISRAVGRAEDWLPILTSKMSPGARVALFQGSAETQDVCGFHRDRVWPLPRGESNYLVTLRFHVEQR